MASQSRPEPMNASPNHSKVRVTLNLSDPVYVSGMNISGKMQLESRTDLDSLLGIGAMMVELYAIQEVNSGEHSATSTFIHSRRIFQGPGLPPSNAVYSDYISGAGELPLPAHHFAARRGQTTFFFRFPIPASSPSSINFGPASIRYEVRASVSVAWRGDRRLVTDKREVKIVERWHLTNEVSLPQAVVITEGGRIWAQATLTSNVVVGGESACIDLQLKNHTQRWTSGVTVTLKRDLHLSTSSLAGKLLTNVSEVATQVEFRGPEYSVPPEVEGIARLVIDIPRHSRGVRGGPWSDDSGNTTEGFFEVRCTLVLRIEMLPGSEDTVLMLPLTVYHSLAVFPIHEVSPYPKPTFYSYPALVPPRLLSPPPGTKLMPTYSRDEVQCDPIWPSPSTLMSHYSPNQHLEQVTRDWQNAPYYLPPMQCSVSVTPLSQVPYFTPGLSTSCTPSPRLFAPLPTHVPCATPIGPGLPTESVGGYTNSDHGQEVITSSLSQNFDLTTHHRSVPANLSSHSQDRSLAPAHIRPSPIQIPPLPNPHDTQGVMHSPRPMPSPTHSYGSVPKSENVATLERMAVEVENSDHSKGGVGVDTQGPLGPQLDQQLNLSADKTAPAPPVFSSNDRQRFAQPPRVDTLFTPEGAMAGHSDFPSTDYLLQAPPTPLIAAITPIKFPKAPTELSGLGANLGRDVPSQSGLDALERRLLAEVGTRKFDVEERPHVRSVVQPITIPPSGPPLDTVNDSAISSLTLADREGFLKASPEREQEQDRDSDERTQHMEGGHSPSEDDRDVRTQKGKNSRKLGKSKHSEEDLERAARRRERKKVKDDEGRKLRQEAKGRVTTWLGGIDISAPPVMDDLCSVISPIASHFVPITESASFGPAPAEMTHEEQERRHCHIPADKDVSASPNPRSSGFVTISSLNASTNDTGGERSSLKPSLRSSSVNDFRQTPISSLDKSTTEHRIASSQPPSTKAKLPNVPPRIHSAQPQPPVHLFSGRLPQFPPRAADSEVKYDVRSARGGRGGKVTQVASLWAAKANANANTNTKVGATTPVPPDAQKVPKALTSPPTSRKPELNDCKRSPIPMRTPVGLNYVAGETRLGGPGTHEVSRATKATTVPAVLSSSHAVPMLSSTASLARVKAHGLGQGQGQARSLPPMISETVSDLRSASKGGTGGLKTALGNGGGGGPGQALGDLAFGQARLRDLIKKYQG